MNAPTDVPGSAPWRYLDPRVAQVLHGQSDDVVARMAAGVVAAVPAFGAPPGSKPQRDLRDAMRVAVERFGELVGTTDEALTPEVREVFRGLGAAEARENRGPEVLQAAVRVSSRLLLRATADSLAERRDLSTDDVLALADAVTAFVDDLVGATTDGYASQVRAVAGERDRMRTRLADLLADGGASVAEATAAAAAIGWPAPERVLPVLLAVDEAREARFRLGDDAVVTERAGRVLALVRAGARTDRDGLMARLHGRGAVVGPAVPWPELPTAIRLTHATVRLLAGDREPRRDPLWVDDHLAALAVRGESGALAMLERRWLAAFDAIGTGQAEALLRTLHVWLRTWGSRSAVAQALYVHPQTVSYRVRRAGEILGADLGDPDTRFELRLVLTARYASTADAT